MNSRLIMVSILIMAGSNVLRPQSIIHPWHVIDRGGGTSNGGSIMLQASIGQSAIQLTSASSTTLESGYMPGVRAYSTSSITTAQIEQGGWNLLSLPLIVSDFRKITLYPSAISSAFIYRGSYESLDTLTNGAGYWLKFPVPETTLTSGTTFSQETVAVSAGWNMIGIPSSPVIVSHITTQGTSVSSNFFGYLSAYLIEDTLEPGLGYWVKVSSTGKLVLPAASARISPSITTSEKETSRLPSQFHPLSDVNTLTVRDALGRTASLYFAAKAGKNDMDRSELPPPPPDGVFDVRYSTGRMLEVTQGNLARTIPILVRSAVYPLTVRWNAGSSDVSSRLLLERKEIELKGSGQVSVPHEQALIKLLLNPFQGEELPKEYTLFQNYPNPFNPTTTVRYALPAESKVTLKVYNVVGQVVAILADGVVGAGYNVVEWDASSVASGVYFYRIEAAGINTRSQTFSQVKKMMLLK